MGLFFSAFAARKLKGEHLLRLSARHVALTRSTRDVNGVRVSARVRQVALTRSTPVRFHPPV